MRPSDPTHIGLAGRHRAAFRQFSGSQLQEPRFVVVPECHGVAPPDWTTGRATSNAGGSRRGRPKMIVSRTPLRISFFGGGTDYPEYFQRARGAVLGMAIDKYVYIAALPLTSAIDYHYRVSYS